MKLQANNFFDEMANSAFTFEALTRVWIGLAVDLPKGDRSDLVKIKHAIMDRTSGVGREISFTGSITIFRHAPEIDEISGIRRIPMSVIAMEEFGYSKELNTTIQMTADFGLPNFGYTHQVARDLDVPAEARMLMNLRLRGVHGPMTGMIDVAVKKELQATISSFPFTNGGTAFRHVGNAANEMKGPDGKVVGYLAFGIMVPQYQLGNVNPTQGAPRLPAISDQERSFLRCEVAGLR